MSQSRVQLGPDGRAVVITDAEAGRAAERLRRRATLLRRAAHPGVVAVQTVTEHPDGSVTLTTVHAGTVVDRPDPAVLSAAAETLADLHDRDIVHGRLGVGHVLVAADGTAVLCGLEGEGAPADDVAALGRVVMALAEGHRGAEAEAVRAAASRAIVDDPAARPSMRSLAAAFGAISAPRLVLPARRPVRAPRRRLLLLALPLLLVVLALARPGTPEPPVASSTTTTVPCPTVTGPDVDGDGCPDDVEIDGPVVRIAGVRWAVGEPGDVAAVGDWDCDGVATPAVLRPSTGELFTYDDWGDDRTARRAGSSPGARTIAAVDSDGDGCDELRPA